MAATRPRKWTRVFAFANRELRIAACLLGNNERGLVTPLHVVYKKDALPVLRTALMSHNTGETRDPHLRVPRRQTCVLLITNSAINAALIDKLNPNLPR